MPGKLACKIPKSLKKQGKRQISFGPTYRYTCICWFLFEHYQNTILVKFNIINSQCKLLLQIIVRGCFKASKLNWRPNEKLLYESFLPVDCIVEETKTATYQFKTSFYSLSSWATLLWKNGGLTGMLIYRNQNARTTNEITIGKSVKSWRSDSLMTSVHFPMILFSNIVHKINDKCNSVSLQLKVIFGRSQGTVILQICNLLLHMFKTPLGC